jgi:two-component sensor histidine kinase/CheY-like chemotaxis protein
MSQQEPKTILLVEDSATLTMITSDTLRGLGYDVIAANTGEKAVEIAVGNEKINLVLMDIELGRGIDGTEAARRILEKRDLPVIFVTSHSEKEFVERVKTVSRYGYVIKNSGAFVMHSAIEMAFELFETNKKTSISEKLYRSLFENMINGFAYCKMHFDEDRPVDFIYLAVNKAFETQTGLRGVTGKKVSEVIPGIRQSDPQLFELYGRVAHTGRPEQTEIYVEALKMWFLISVYSPQKEYFVAVFEVITERKLAEEKIKTLLAEKELILKEVHHRIKNNMSAIAGLMSLQASALNDTAAVAALEDARSRVLSMMVLYDKLYCTDNFDNLSFGEYLSSLVDEIIENFPNKEIVKVEKNIVDFPLDAKRTSNLGLIINELITNIMKYAFTGRQSGIITLSAAAVDNRIKISIQDNGIGIPESIDIDNSIGFGLQLVDMMSKSLDGTIKIERNNGTRFILEFKL